MRNWKIQKFWSKRQSETVWLHWWCIADLEKLKADIEAIIKRKQNDSDYSLIATKLRPI